MSSPGGRPRAKADDEGHGGGIGSLAAVLGDRRCAPERRKLAAVSLGRSGDPRALEPLIRAVGDDPDVAVAAADALGRMGDPAAVGPLVAALERSDDLSVREHAIAALGKIGDPRAIDPLIAKLKDRGEAFNIRKKAARTLYVIYKQGRLNEEDQDKVLTSWHSWYLL